MGGTAAFIDAEHALDPVYAARLGVDTDNLYVAQPDTGEQALEITEALVRSGAIDIVTVDSVAALVPKAEIDGEMGDAHVGLQARLMSQALRKLAGVVSKSNTSIIFINQLREKVGVVYGNPEVTTGGKALKFYASIRMDVRRGEAIKNGNEIIGNRRIWPSRATSSPAPARGIPSATCASPRGGTTCACTSRRTRTSARRWKRSCAKTFWRRAPALRRRTINGRTPAAGTKRSDPMIQ